MLHIRFIDKPELTTYEISEENYRAGKFILSIDFQEEIISVDEIEVINESDVDADIQACEYLKAQKLFKEAKSISEYSQLGPKGNTYIMINNKYFLLARSNQGRFIIRLAKESGWVIGHAIGGDF